MIEASPWLQPGEGDRINATGRRGTGGHDHGTEAPIRGTLGQPELMAFDFLGSSVLTFGNPGIRIRSQLSYKDRRQNTNQLVAGVISGLALRSRSESLRDTAGGDPIIDMTPRLRLAALVAVACWVLIGCAPPRRP